MPGKKHLRGVGAKEQRMYEHIKGSVAPEDVDARHGSRNGSPRGEL